MFLSSYSGILRSLFQTTICNVFTPKISLLECKLEPSILYIKIRPYILFTSCSCRQLLVIAFIIDKADITSPLQYFQANLKEIK